MDEGRGVAPAHGEGVKGVGGWRVEGTQKEEILNLRSFGSSIRMNSSYCTWKGFGGSKVKM